LLRRLWIAAGLNKWSEKESNRRYSRIASDRLKEAMSDVICNGKPLAEIGIVLRHGLGFEAAQAQSLVDACQAAQSRALIISVLTAAPTQRLRRQDWNLSLEGADDASLYPVISDDCLGKWRDRFKTEAALLDSREGSVFFIGTARLNRWSPPNLLTVNTQDLPPSRYYADIEEYALMATSGDGSLIPVDSGYELRVAKRLMHDRRVFQKPLAAEDPRPGEIGLPDFRLCDTNGPQPMVMEVFGRSLADRVYQVRKRQKIAHNDERFGPDGWWQWDAAMGGDMPDFPPRT